MNAVTVVAMLIAAGAMVFGLQKSKQGVQWGKPLTIIGAVVVLGFALSSLFTGGGASARKIQDVHKQYRAICGQKVGMYLAENFDGKKAALLLPYQMGEGTNPHQEVFLDSLKEAMGGNVSTVAEITPEPPPEVKRMEEEMRKQMEEEMAEMGEEMPADEMAYAEPMYSWFTARQLDSLLSREASNADLLVSIAELPPDVLSASFWRQPNAPKVVITQGPIYDFAGAIKAGAVVAAVAHNPQAEYEPKAPPKDVDKAFAKRYLLITPDNIDSLRKQYPKLFPSE